MQNLVGYFEQGRPALKTYNNRRGIVSTFLKFAFLRGWIAENPIAKVPQHRIRRRRGMAATLSAAQARELMEHMEGYEGGRWVPYFALCLFAGIRPSVPHGEITKLKPEAIDLDAGVISVSAEVSKVREPRKVVIQPNLAAWLRAYPLERFPLVVTNFYERRGKIGKQFGLTHDVMRHTFISMFVAKFRSIGEAAIQAGNSEGIIRRHYLDLKSAGEAEDYWSILPQRAIPQAAPLEVLPAPAVFGARRAKAGDTYAILQPCRMARGGAFPPHETRVRFASDVRQSSENRKCDVDVKGTVQSEKRARLLPRTLVRGRLLRGRSDNLRRVDRYRRRDSRTCWTGSGKGVPRTMRRDRSTVR